MIDLFLGSDLGLWVLDHIEPEQVNFICSNSKEIIERAKTKGYSKIFNKHQEMKNSLAPAGLSIHYPRILLTEFIESYEKVYNLHPAYLPWGRGYYPIFWALWEEYPAGATLHEMTAGVDEGPIVAQIPVEYFEEDTGLSLFQRVRKAEKKLFLQYINQLSQNIYPPVFPQNFDIVSIHTKQQFFELKQHSQWENMTSRQLIKLIQCLSFEGYTGLELSIGKKKFSLSMTEIPENKDIDENKK